MHEISHILRPHIHAIAFAIVATILVIFGTDINKRIKHAVRKQHFIIRLLVFVLVCAFGYGVATVFIAKVAGQMLAGLDDRFLAITIACIFLLLGLLAEKRRQI